MAYVPFQPYASLSGQVGYGSGLQLVDEVLSQVAKQFRPSGYLYDDIVAHIPVNYSFGIYPVFDPSTFFQDGGDLDVADDAETPLIDFNWSVDQYTCRVKRLKTKLTQEEALQANPALRLDYSKTIGLMTTFATNREKRLAALLKAQSNGGSFTNAAVTPSVKWDNGTTNTPATIQADIQNAELVAMKASGKRPNTIIFDYEVALAIANDPTIKTQIQYRIGEQVFAQQLADVLAGTASIDGLLPKKLFGLNVLVADGALSATTRPGQTLSLSGIWGTSARLVYVDPNAQWGMPATAYSFRAPVTGTVAQPPSVILPTDSGGQEPGPLGDWAVVDRWWVEDPPSEHIRVRERVDERCVAPELGVEIQNVISSSDDTYEY